MNDGLVTVFQTDDVVLIALAKAALEAEQIPYVSQGKGFQDWLFPGGYNPVTGPVRFQVATEDADRAREALEGIGDKT
jgi:Putative prokaryotic signal transducing protein